MSAFRWYWPLRAYSLRNWVRYQEGRSNHSEAGRILIHDFGKIITFIKYAMLDWTYRKVFNAS